MLYGRVGYAKWVNFEHLYPKCCGIQVQIITLTTSNMGNCFFFVQIKRGAVKKRLKSNVTTQMILTQPSIYKNTSILSDHDE
jgi:hypothetical protein